MHIRMKFSTLLDSPHRTYSETEAEKWQRLFEAARCTLEFWIARLQAEARKSFPEKVTAFRKGMAVHGRYK